MPDNKNPIYRTMIEVVPHYSDSCRFAFFGTPINLSLPFLHHQADDFIADVLMALASLSDNPGWPGVSEKHFLSKLVTQKDGVVSHGSTETAIPGATFEWTLDYCREKGKENMFKFSGRYFIEPNARNLPFVQDDHRNAEWTFEASRECLVYSLCYVHHYLSLDMEKPRDLLACGLTKNDLLFWDAINLTIEWGEKMGFLTPPEEEAAARKVRPKKRLSKGAKNKIRSAAKKQRVVPYFQKSTGLL